MADILNEAAAFQLHSVEVLLFTFGLYSWEFLVSLWFEWNLCLRRLPFKWPLIPYFLARYAALIGLIANMTLAVSTKPVNCHALYELALIFGNSAIAASSCNLMVRAIIIWTYRWYIVIPLTSIAIGQWILFGVGFRNSFSVWDPEAGICVGASPDLRFVGAYGIYTAGFDLLILIASLVGLSRVRGSPSFISILRTQGIVYYVLVLAVHASMAIFSFAVSNPAYSSFSGVIAMSLSPAVSCRMVRSILKTSATNGSYSDRWRTKASAATETGDGLVLSTRINLDTSSRARPSRKHEETHDPAPAASEDRTAVGLDSMGIP